MSKLQIEIWPIGKVKPFDDNAKKHPEEQVAALAAAIKELGWDQPIVVDEKGSIIKGHGRRLAAIRLGFTEVPVLVRRDLTPAQVRAARLSDNKVTSTDYDTELLQKELAELTKNLGFDMGLVGFSDKEIAMLTIDVGGLDASAFVDDVNGAVAEQKAENEEKVEAAGQTDVAIGEVLGFKRISTDEARRVRAFMAQLETETGKKGAEAFLSFVETAVAA